MLLEAFRARTSITGCRCCRPAPTSPSRLRSPARRASTTRRSSTTATSSPSRIPSSGPIRAGRPGRPRSRRRRSPSAIGAGARRALRAPSARRLPDGARRRRRRTRSPGSRSSSSATSTRCRTARRWLAALGARVIKLEDGNGDPHRSSFGPEVGHATRRPRARRASRSTCARRRAARSRSRSWPRPTCSSTASAPASPRSWGSATRSSRTINPRLLYVHAAGYGTDGPYAHRALYAQAAQAVAGSFGRQVGYWIRSRRRAEGFSVIELQAVVVPRLGQVVDGDSNAALARAGRAGARPVPPAAHRRRASSSRTSMIGGNAWAYSDDFCTLRRQAAGSAVRQRVLRHPALDRVYPAAGDSWVCLRVRTDAEFAALRGARRARARRRRALRRRGRAAEHDDALVASCSSAFIARPAAEWEALMQRPRVGCVAVNMTGQPVVHQLRPGPARDRPDGHLSSTRCSGRWSAPRRR